jgi:Na+/H+ antiporter NhaC
LASVLGQSIPAFVFPLVVFLTAAVTAFATGTSWGTMAILIPTLAPVAFVMDGEVFGLITALVLAAVLDGAIMGDHCSPISDTTIMSSIASSCDHMAHVRTQLPYSLVVALLAGIFGYLPVALGMNSWLMLVVVVIFMIGFFAMKRWQQKSTALPLGASD